MFTYVAGADAQYEAIKANTLETALTVNAVPVRAQAIDDGYPVLDVPSPAGGVMMMYVGKAPAEAVRPRRHAPVRPMAR